MEEVLKRVEVLSHEPVDSLEAKMRQYDQWSSHFEEDVSKLAYRAPKLAVELLYKVNGSCGIELNSRTKIIDFAAGTGLVAKQLRDKGFCGEIDAQDGSAGMLQIAREKGLYRNIYQCVIKPDLPLPIPEQSYDVGFICGALSDSQVHSLCIKLMLNHIKVGGVFVFSTRSNKSNLAYKSTLDSEVQKLAEAGLWKKVIVENVAEFEKSTSLQEIVQTQSTVGSTELYPYISGSLYCYEKLM